MVLKLIVVAFLVYWIIRAALNMWVAIAGDRRTVGSKRERFDDQEIRREVKGVKYEQTWTIDPRPGRVRHREAVEDARFRDV